MVKTTIVSDTKKYPEARGNRIIDVQPTETLGTQINRKFGFRKIRIVIENKPKCQQQKAILDAFTMIAILINELLTNFNQYLYNFLASWLGFASFIHYHKVTWLLLCSNSAQCRIQITIG